MSDTFAAERATCIGGSDIHHLLGLRPYGCKRRLFYEKAGLPADFPFTGNAATKRGNALEPIAAREYEAATGRTCGLVDFERHKDYPFFGVHVDRFILDRPGGREGRGILEIKCPGRDMYQYVKAYDPLLSWQLQAQHGMGIMGYKWGSIYVFCADLWEGVWWDYDFNQGTMQAIYNHGVPFWQSVEAAKRGDPAAMPPALQDGDSRCTHCAWRRLCKGLDMENPGAVAQGDDDDTVPHRDAVIDLSLDRLARDVFHARKDARAIIKSKEELEDLLEERMGDRTDIYTGSMTLVRKKKKKKGYEVKASEYMTLTLTPDKEDTETCEPDSIMPF